MRHLRVRDIYLTVGGAPNFGPTVRYMHGHVVHVLRDPPDMFK